VNADPLWEWDSPQKGLVNALTALADPTTLLLRNAKFAPMPEQSNSAVVLFADITHASGLFSELGATWAVDVISSVHEHLREVTRRHHGEVIKTVGTEIICSFDRPDDAAMATGDMHLRIRRAAEGADPERREEVGMRDIRLSMGLHFGPILAEDGDVFGDTVNVAARLMGMAKAGQTLCSRQLVDELAIELRSSIRFFNKVSPRGKSEAVEIHEMLWEVEDLTIEATVMALPQQRKRHGRLHIRCGGEEFELGDAMPTLSIGRSADNDLVYPGNFASRKHAEIEYARGRFSIMDQSANGTYVVCEDGTVVPLRRDKHVLDGVGSIYLGELPESHPTAVIKYNCE